MLNGGLPSAGERIDIYSANLGLQGEELTKFREENWQITKSNMDQLRAEGAWGPIEERPMFIWGGE